MSMCAVKRGFVALRDCGNEAKDSCADCSRDICAEHTRVEGTAILCIECFAKRQQAIADAAAKEANRGKFSLGDSKKAKGFISSPKNDDWTDTSWAYTYRTHYYSLFGYNPLFWGHHQPYYDSYDVRSFDEYEEGAPSEDESAAGFYDS